MDFVLANSAYPDEMLHYVAFHLGLHYLPKYPLVCVRSTKVKGVFHISLDYVTMLQRYQWVYFCKIQCSMLNYINNV